MNLKYILGAIGLTSLISCSNIPKTKDEIKIANRIISDTVKNKNINNVLVVDAFKKKNLSVDLDLHPDIPHGGVVSTIIEKGLPIANVYKIDIPMGKDFYIQNTSKNKFIPKSDNIDAINLSIGITMPFKNFSEQTGINLTPENLSSKVREVKNYLINNKAKSLYNGTEDSVKVASVVNFIDDLDSLSAKGSKIYVAAGNDGPQNFNLLSLIDNSITVGALESNGEKAKYSADNSLVKRWENGVLKIKKTDKGYNFSGKEGTDIGFEYTSSYIHFPGLNLKGTSNATPKALVKDMINSTK